MQPEDPGGVVWRLLSHRCQPPENFRRPGSYGRRSDCWLRFVSTIESEQLRLRLPRLASSPSDHVFLAQGDMRQISQDVQQRDMRFLDAVNAITGDCETVLGSVC